MLYSKKYIPKNLFSKIYIYKYYYHENTMLDKNN